MDAGFRVTLSSLLIVSAITVGSQTWVGVAQATDSGACPTAALSYAGGTGTAGDPFRINTAEQLQRLRDTHADWNAAVTLTSDIDMGGCVWGTTLGDTRVVGTGWGGPFNGGGHTVSGLDINLVGASFAGFFAYLGTGSSVSGLGFTGNVSLTNTGAGSADADAGGLAGFTLNVPISDSFATGDVSATVTVTADDTGDASAQVNLGGLVGYSQGSITTSFATGETSANVTATGGVATGSVNVSLSIGGFLGNKAANVVTDSYSTGALGLAWALNGGSSQVLSVFFGGFIGTIDNSASATDTFWNETTSGSNRAVGFGSSTGVSGLTSLQMRDFATFGPAGANWSIADGYSDATTWSMCPLYNLGFPFLSAFVTPAVCDPSPPSPPAPPVPADAPQSVEVTAGDRAVAVSWAAPASSGSFPVSNYQVSGSPSGACLVPSVVLSCEVSGLRNGETYAFRVRALTGAGWGAWSESVTVVPQPAAPSILITGSREGRSVVVEGVTTGLVGERVTPWVRFPGPGRYAPGSGVQTVSADGSFRWQRVTKKKVYVYFRTGEVRSDRVIIPAR